MNANDRDSKTTPIKIADASFALFIAGAVIGALEYSGAGKFGLGFEMVSIARNLAETGRYANPIQAVATGFTAANPPLYPVFLALLFRFLKTPSLVVFAACATNIIANAFTASLLPRVSQLIYGNVEPGMVAGVLWLMCAQIIPSWDTDITVAGVVLFFHFIASVSRARRDAPFNLVAGVIAGLLFLSNPSTLLIVLPTVGYLLLRRQMSVKQSAIIVATLSLFILGWNSRNYVRLGAFVTRTNLGQTLYASNNDCAVSSMVGEELNNCYGTHHPNENLTEAELQRSLGEVQYDRMRTKDTMAWIRTHSYRFLDLTMKRFREFWFPAIFWSPSLEQHPYQVCAVWLATILSIPGLILMVLRREPITLFVFAVSLVYPPIYYVVVSDLRYRYPVLWLSLLPAGYLVWHVRACSPALMKRFAAGSQ